MVAVWYAWNRSFWASSISWYRYLSAAVSTNGVARHDPTHMTVSFLEEYRARESSCWLGPATGSASSASCSGSGDEDAEGVGEGGRDAVGAREGPALAFVLGPDDVGRARLNADMVSRLLRARNKRPRVVTQRRKLKIPSSCFKSRRRAGYQQLGRRFAVLDVSSSSRWAQQRVCSSSRLWGSQSRWQSMRSARHQAILSEL